MDEIATDYIYCRIMTLVDEVEKSLYRVAVDGGLERNQIYNLMKRGSMPDLRILNKICRGLDVTLKEFFDEEFHADKNKRILIETYRSFKGQENRNRFTRYVVGFAGAMKDENTEGLKNVNDREAN